MRKLLVLALSLGVCAGPTRHTRACCGNRAGPLTPTSGPSGGGGCSGAKCEPCEKTKSPNFIMSGNYRYEQTDLTISGLGPPISAYRVYNAHDSWIGPVGRGWHHSLIVQAVKMRDDLGEYVMIRMPSAQRVTFTKSGEIYVPPLGHHETLTRQEDGTMILYWEDGSTWLFNADGWIGEQMDRYGNATTWVYATVNGQIRPVEVQGSAGRKVTIAWNGASRIHSLTDHTGRVVTYTYDQENNLSGVEDAAGRTWTYTYELLGKLALLASIDFMGLPYASATYDSTGRTIAYMEDGAQWTIEYQPSVTTCLRQPPCRV